ncbi:MAG: SRPBCC family protein [Chloroflexi bacterium]|nr:SRPBCC family protein [Chloroflexota bacterium]
MATISTSGTGNIGRPTQEVWDFMVDPATLYKWVKNVKKPGNWLGDGSPEKIGSRYRIDYEYGRKSNEIIFEVTSSFSGRSFGVNTVEGPYPITADYELVGSPDGNSTSVSFAMTARSDSKFTAAMFILTGWFASYFMRRMLNKELDELAAALSSK